MISAVLFSRGICFITTSLTAIGCVCAHFIAACQRIFPSHHRMGGEEEDRGVRVGRGEREREARGGGAGG